MEVERREETNNEEISGWRKWDWKKAWWWQPDQKDVFVQGFKRMKLDGVKEAMKPDIHISKRYCVHLFCTNFVTQIRFFIIPFLVSNFTLLVSICIITLFSSHLHVYEISHYIKLRVI